MKRATGALEDGRYRHLPFVEDGKVVGIVSRFDVSRHRAGSLDEKISRRSAFDGARGSVQQNGSAYDDDGAVGETNHFLRDAADEQPDESAVATAADNDQIGSPVSCRGNDFPGRIAERRPGRDTRRPLRNRLSASITQHVLRCRESELSLGYRDVLHPRISLDLGWDLRRKTGDDCQQD